MSKDEDIDKLVSPVSQGPGAVWDQIDRVRSLAQLCRQARNERDRLQGILDGVKFYREQAESAEADAEALRLRSEGAEMKRDALMRAAVRMLNAPYSGEAGSDPEYGAARDELRYVTGFDAGNIERNHYDWFWPSHVPYPLTQEWIVETRQKMLEARTDPFCDDSAEIMLVMLDQLQEFRDSRFQPLGDNHHNALACPYCNPNRLDPERERMRAEAAELDAEKRLVALRKVSPCDCPTEEIGDCVHGCCDEEICTVVCDSCTDSSVAPTLMLSAEEAWARDKHIVGKAVHEAWMAEKQRQGFADHPYVETATHRCQTNHCDLPAQKHHPDMLPYEDLTPEDQAYDYASGEVAYMLGWEARNAM